MRGRAAGIEIFKSVCSYPCFLKRLFFWRDINAAGERYRTRRFSAPCCFPPYSSAAFRCFSSSAPPCPFFSPAPPRSLLRVPLPPLLLLLYRLYRARFFSLVAIYAQQGLGRGFRNPTEIFSSTRTRRRRMTRKTRTKLMSGRRRRPRTNHRLFVARTTDACPGYPRRSCSFYIFLH